MALPLSAAISFVKSAISAAATLSCAESTAAGSPESGSGEESNAEGALYSSVSLCVFQSYAP